MRAWRGPELMAVATVVAIALGPAADAWGQMFGDRSIRRDLNAQEIGTAGVITGSERFLRDARSPLAFVGPSAADVDAFVGAQQATPPAPPRPVARPNQAARQAATPARRVNRPHPELGPEQPYPPRLDVSGLERPATAERLDAQAAEFQHRLEALLAQHAESRIEVSLEGRQAILQGVVASESDRQLAELILSFEPGVSAVRNQLQVMDDLPLPSPPDGPLLETP